MAFLRNFHLFLQKIKTMDALLDLLAVHHVGNKAADESLLLTNTMIRPNEAIKELLQTYFLSPFKTQQYYNLWHEEGFENNPVYQMVSAIFDEPEVFIDRSKELAKWLFEQATHPKIKSGEFYVALFRECHIEGEVVDAVGLFKSENKDTYLKVYANGNQMAVESDDGFNINKLDKGCLIYNHEREKGYVVSVVDNTNRGADALYWIDSFLGLRLRSDAFSHTTQTMTMCRKFINEELPGTFEVSKADQADMLNRSLGYFKEAETFSLDDFNQKVMQQPEVMETFNNYCNKFAEEYDVELPEEFDLSEQAVKKEAKGMKSVVKLDKNFHIYIHGDRARLRRGVDEETGLRYYQLLYETES